VNGFGDGVQRCLDVLKALQGCCYILPCLSGCGNEVCNRRIALAKYSILRSNEIHQSDFYSLSHLLSLVGILESVTCIQLVECVLHGLKVALELIESAYHV